MPKKNISPPTGLKKWLFRLPIYVYKWGFGWLMPKRFLFLTHIGRKSGQLRYAVLEVADYDSKNDIYFIVAGFGKQSNWYQNLLATPTAQIQVGRRKLGVAAKPLTQADSGQKMVAYAQTYPRTARQLMAFIGYETDGSEQSYRQIGEEKVHFMALVVQPAN